jgi:hypothetical protein
MNTFFRYDSWTKTAQGPAVPGAQIFVLGQPANLPGSLVPVPPSPTLQVYGDVNGLSALQQPLIADGFGHVSFYLPTDTAFTLAVYLGGMLQNSYADQFPMGAGASGSVPGSGNSGLYATASTDLTTAPAGDLLIADGLGNVQDSAVKISSLMAGTNQINLSEYVSAPRTGKFAMHSGAITSGTASLSIGSSYGLFTSGDAGKTIVVEGAGPNGSNLVTTISSVTSSSSATLAANASTRVSIAVVAWYSASQDDTAAFKAAMNALEPGTGVLYAPGDVYVISSPITASANLSALIGDGISNTLFLYVGTSGSFLTVSSPVSGLTLGGSPREGFTVLGPGSQPFGNITNVALTSDVATFTQTNSYTNGQPVLVQGLTTTNGAQFNDIIYTVTGSAGSSWTGTGLSASNIPSTADSGGASLNYCAFQFTASGMDWVSAQNIEIHAFPGDGLQWSDDIVTDFRKVMVWNCGGNGFCGLKGTAGVAGTATHFDTTWANGCQKAGYYLFKEFYSSFSNTAADGNGIGYFLNTCIALTFVAPGQESQVYRNAAYPGYGYLFDHCSSIVLNSPYCFVGTGAGNAASTPLVFRNNTREFTVLNQKYNNASGETDPTYLWSVDSTCQDYMIVAPNYGVLATSAFQNLGSNGMYLRNAGFVTPLTASDGLTVTGGVIADSLNISGGTAITAGDVSIAGGWGSTATVSLVAGTLNAFVINVASSGTGQTPSPTITINITGAGFSNNPLPIFSNRGTTTSGLFSLSSVSSTSLTLTYQGTPVAGDSYGLTVLVVSQG